MPLGQSAFVAVTAHTLTRSVVHAIATCTGASPSQAAAQAHKISMKVAASASAFTSVVTADALGAAGAAAYLGVMMAAADANKQKPSKN